LSFSILAYNFSSTPETMFNILNIQMYVIKKEVRTAEPKTEI